MRREARYAVLRNRRMSREYIEITEGDREWLAKLGLDRVGRVLKHDSADVAAVSRSSDIFRVPVDESFGGPTSVFVKRYHYDRLSQRIKQMFRGTLLGKSRARFEFEFLHTMRQRGVPTVRPIAYGELRRRGFLRAGIILTAGQDGVESLDVYYLKVGDLLPDREVHESPGEDGPAHLSVSAKRALIAELAAAIRQMHDVGVKHGGLFWRNILIRTDVGKPVDAEAGAETTHENRFMFLDPDTQGRLHEASIPRKQAVSDLSDTVASALAVGMRAGVLRFMRAYFRAPRLTSSHRAMIRKVVSLARKKSRAEEQRMAVTESLGLLRRRVGAGGAGTVPPMSVDSVDEFFERLVSIEPDARARKSYSGTVHFTFEDQGRSKTLHRTLTLDGGVFRVADGTHGTADLTVASDVETWLAIASGKEDAFALIRSGMLRVQGDTRLLAEMAARLGS